MAPSLGSDISGHRNTALRVQGRFRSKNVAPIFSTQPTIHATMFG